MGTITLPSSTHDRLRLVAAALGRSEAATVAELLDRLAGSGQASGENGEETRTEVPIHAKYEGKRIEALFDPDTGRVTITSGDLAGKACKSPSRAAIEVVTLLNPGVNPNRNGWSFWIVTATDESLQSIRRK
jgi:hypothetical protein